MHLLFHHPGEGFGNTARRLGPKIDTRGEGGYKLPPIDRPSGRRHGRDAHGRARPAPLPEALKRLLTAPERPEDPFFRAEGRAGQAWARAALEGELGRELAAPVGERDNTLSHAVFRLAKLVAGGGVDEAEVKARLRAAGLAFRLDTRGRMPPSQAPSRRALPAPRP